MSIKFKTLLLGLIIPLAALVMLSAISGRYLREVATEAVRTTTALGRDAALTGGAALEHYSSYLLQNVVRYRAQCGDQKLARLADQLQLFAALISATLADPAAIPLAANSENNENSAAAAPIDQEAQTVAVQLGDTAFAEAAANFPRWASRDFSRTAPLLRQFAELSPSRDIYFCSITGELRGFLGASPRAQNFAPPSAYPEWFRDAARRRQFGWTSVYTDAASGELMIIGYAPIFAAAENSAEKIFVAAVAVAVRVAEITDELLDIPYGDAATMAVVAVNEPRVLFAVQKDPDATGARELTQTDFTEALAPVISALRESQEGLREITFNRQKCVAAFAPLLLPQWGLCAIVPESALFATPRRLAQKLVENSAETNRKIYRHLFYEVKKYFAAIVLVLLAAAILSSLLARRINTGLQALSAGAASIGKGNFSETIQIGGRDEITALAQDFNAMAARLQTFTQRLAKTERLEGEMQAAKEIQISMLPAELPARPEFALAAVMEPAREVGGDFYDFFPLDDRRLALVVGDISGKGVPAALLMAIGKSLLKNLLARHAGDLCRAFGELNDFFIRDSRSGYFLTLFAAVIDLRTGVMNFVNAGHNPPFYTDGATGEFHALARRENKNPAIGIRESHQFAGGEIRLTPEARLFIYTDGVTEAENSAQAQFGEIALAAALNEYRALPLAELSEKIRARIAAFADNCPAVDDLTMLLFAWHGTR